MKIKLTIAQCELIKQRKNVFLNDISAGQYQLSSGLFGDLTNLMKTILASQNIVKKIHFRVVLSVVQ